MDTGRVQAAKMYISKLKLLGIDGIDIQIKDDNDIVLESYKQIKNIDNGIECVIIPGFITYVRPGIFRKVSGSLKVVYNGNGIRDISNMFEGYCGKYIDLSDFNTSSVESMYNMFYRCKSLEKIDLSNFATSNVRDMSGIFRGCISLKELDLSSFDTSKVESMQSMFNSCEALSIDN